MPNWCNNALVIKHEDAKELESLEEVVTKYIEEGEEGEFFGHILPEPVYEEDEKSGTMPAWWNWRVENWGTKWDASFGDNTSGYSHCFNAIIDGKLRLNFDTAWAPPYGVVNELIKQGFDVEHIYMEQGMDYWGWDINGEEIAKGAMSEYSVDKFGNTYSEWNDLPDGAIGKGESKEVTGLSGKYTWTEYEHEWEFDIERSKLKAKQIGISEETWNKCDLEIIRGG